MDLLNDNTAKVKKHTLATLTGAMNAAATQDVRAMKFVPLLARLLKGGTSPSARATRMLELLEEWRAQGGSRLDRDLDGKIDHPGAAILDTAWNRLADAAMTPVLGKPLADQLGSTLHSRYDLPPSGQFSGWHMYMSKDLRSLLGEPVKGAFANRYCGDGDVNVCRAALWAALEAAGRGARGGPGSRPGRLARGRHPRADRLPAGPAHRTRSATRTGRAESSRSSSSQATAEARRLAAPDPALEVAVVGGDLGRGRAARLPSPRMPFPAHQKLRTSRSSRPVPRIAQLPLPGTAATLS